MSTDTLLLDTAERIFSDHCDKALLDAAEAGTFAQALSRLLADNGFLALGMSDSGFSLDDVFSLLRLAGRHAVPLPLAEQILANRWLDQTELLASVGLGVSDVVEQVPWGRSAQIVVGISPTGGGAVSVRPASTVVDVNLAGEPRDRVSAEQVTPLDCKGDHCFELLALARAVQTVGSLERMLELCLSYANEREQFGRPIAKFQAIQHNLAVLAAEVAAAGRAGDAAVAALGGARARVELAAAKARIGEAAGTVAEIAHQVHGAMGFTHEHQLHHFTRRAWAWRDEFGNDGYWRRELGTRIASIGADETWDFIATRG